MALRDIVFEGDPKLRKISRKVEVFDGKLGTLIDDMIETMRHNDGVGLAAPQVGVLRRVIVMEVDDKVYECVNPVIVKTKGEVEATEGCLSIKNLLGIVKRPEKVVMTAQDRFGNEFELKADGLLAVVCCHETDHLDGILFRDKMIREAEQD